MNTLYTHPKTPCRCSECYNVALSNDLQLPDFCLACWVAECDGEQDCRPGYDWYPMPQAEVTL